MKNTPKKTIPATSSKQYDRITPKRKRKDVLVKTKTYLKQNNKASTKRQKTSKHTSSTSTKLLSNDSKVSSSADNATPSTNTSPPASSRPKQSSITSYLGAKTTSKLTTLKVEQFFKVPDYSKGFNLLSLRRHFPSVTLKPNIVSLIKKTVQHNNVIARNVVVKQCVNTRTSARIHTTTQKQHQSTKQQCQNKPNHRQLLVTVFNPSGSIHHCFVEDFISLPVASSITILLPVEQCEKANKVTPTFDFKFLQLLSLFEFAVTSIGDSDNLFYVIEAVILSSPNRNQATMGIDKQSLQEGLNGNKKFGCVVSVQNSGITPLVKWKDVLNGRRNGLMVSVFFSFKNNIIIKVMISSCF